MKDVYFLCASLSDQHERKISFSSCFKDKNIFRFVESVDGRYWSDEQADFYVDDELKDIRKREKSKNKHWLNPALIACTLTHRDRLLKLAEQKPLILCEDDVLIEEEFIEQWLCQKTQSKLNSLDGVVLLHYISKKPIMADPRPIYNFGKYSVHKIEQGSVASGACYFSPTTIAVNIRANQIPIKVSVDNWSKMKQLGFFKEIYAIHPSPCQIAGMASTIGYGDDNKSNALWIVLGRRIKRTINRYRKSIHESLTMIQNK